MGVVRFIINVKLECSQLTLKILIRPAPIILAMEPKPGGGVVHGPHVLVDKGPIKQD